MTEYLYSIRMHASLKAAHISGAERIISFKDIPTVTDELVARAMGHERGRPDSVTVTIDSLAGKEFLKVKALPITDLVLDSHFAGRERAIVELVRAGVSEAAARAALAAITGGASWAGGNMRGAMVVDSLTGRRLEPDAARGVRAREFDYDEANRSEVESALEMSGLQGTRLMEALVLATKVAHAPGAVAELCISDDPGYVTGYVASRANGYVRITPLKRIGDRCGGRAFFVDGAAIEIGAYLNYLQGVPVLVTGPVELKG